jgi:tryptophan-rich sensory protein
MFFQKQIPFIVVLPFILNLIFNFSFTYFQFGLKNNLLAGADVFLVFVTLVWAMVAIYFTSEKLVSAGGPSIMWVAYMQIPYLLWVTFATILQFTITYLNR